MGHIPTHEKRHVAIFVSLIKTCTIQDDALYLALFYYYLTILLNS